MASRDIGLFIFILRLTWTADRLDERAVGAGTIDGSTREFLTADRIAAEVHRRVCAERIHSGA
jgi:hypothetical protein